MPTSELESAALNMGGEAALFKLLEKESHVLVVRGSEGAQEDIETFQNIRTCTLTFQHVRVCFEHQGSYLTVLGSRDIEAVFS